MTLYRAAGIGILILSLSVATSGGQAIKREDMPKYISLLKAPDAKTRAMAAEKIGKRGQVSFKDVEKAVEPLKQTLQSDPDARARKAAAIALGSIHPEAEGTVPTLIAAVKMDASIDVKVAAAESLGVFGAEAKDGAPAIRDLMGKFTEKKDRMIRKTLADSLGKVTGKMKKK
jgi:hypothetical protein